MEIRYNVTGAKRKELVKVIANATGARAEYKFMPTCNYEIDYFTVTKDGTLLFDDRADSEEVERVLEAISAAGFECEPQDGGEQPFGEENKEAAEAADTAPQAANVGLTVEIPLDKVAVGNLTKLLDAKGHRGFGRPGGISLVLPGGHRFRSRLYPLHFRALRDEQECQAGNSD